MSDVLQQLEELRQEVAELRSGLAALQGRQPSEHRDGDGTMEILDRLMRQHILADGKTRGIAVITACMVLNEPNRCGLWTDFDTKHEPEFISEKEMFERIARLTFDPIALRAQRLIVQRFLAGKGDRIAASELLQELAVDPAALDQALNPLMELGWLRWTKTPSEGEQWELTNPRPFLTLVMLGRA